MFMLEFHPAEGGADAEAFAIELAASVAKTYGLAYCGKARVATVGGECL